jgi:protein ImuB
VVTPVPQGGRTPAERVRWVPWGEPREPESGRPVDLVSGPVARERPSWPGAVPGPAPARVLRDPVPAALLDAAGRPVTVTARGDATAVPARLQCDALPRHGGEVTAWAGPWPQDVRWWDGRARSRRVHWHVVVGEIACLVRTEHGTTTLDALYD